jgi:hypothetical protein
LRTTEARPARDYSARAASRDDATVRARLAPARRARRIERLRAGHDERAARVGLLRRREEQDARRRASAAA